MKMKSILPIFVMLVIGQAHAADLYSVQLAYKVHTTASYNMTVKLPDGSDLLTAVTSDVELKLFGTSKPVRENFSSDESLVEFIQTHYCGEAELMTGSYSSSSIGKSSPISMSVKANRIIIQGIRNNGEKVNAYIDCR